MEFEAGEECAKSDELLAFSLKFINREFSIDFHENRLLEAAMKALDKYRMHYSSKRSGYISELVKRRIFTPNVHFSI
jgi:hypothetical protein